MLVFSLIIFFLDLIYEDVSLNQQLLLEKSQIDYKNITDEEWSMLYSVRSKDIKAAVKKNDIVSLFKKWPSYKYEAKHVSWLSFL